MNIIIQLGILLGLLGYVSIVPALQTCLSESKIPASTPTEQFVDHGDGTVTDKETGLMWAKCAGVHLSGTDCDIDQFYEDYTWKDALTLARVSTLAGHDDWRLPNVNELHSIVEERCDKPSINPLIFPNTYPSVFWSSSPYVNDTNYAWVVGFGSGFSSISNRDWDRPVRLVRDAE